MTVPGTSVLIQDVVTAVERVDAEGLFNPYTNDGARSSFKSQPKVPWVRQSLHVRATYAVTASESLAAYFSLHALPW